MLLTGSSKAVSCLIMSNVKLKDPLLSVVRVGYRVPLADFCLSLYSLHVLNRDVDTLYDSLNLAS